MLCAGFATFSLLYATQPLLPVLAAEYGLSAELSSLAVSAATGPLAVGILIAGSVSDRVGRRPLMVAGTMAAAVLTIAAAAAPGWWALIALRVLTGVALAGVPAVAMAYVADEVDAGDAGAAMGLYIAGSALGGMSGRLLAGVLADIGDWRWALAGVGLLGLVMAEAFRRLAPASRRFVPASARPSLAPLRDPVLRLLYGLAFLLMGAFVTLYNYAGFRLLAPPYGLSQAAVGAVFLLYLLGAASSAWFGARAASPGWPIAVMIAGIALTLASPLPLVIAGIGLATIGFFGAHALASAAVGRRAGVARGQAAAWYLFAYYAGSSLLGTAGGVAWSAAGWLGVAAFCLLLALIALGGTALIRRASV